MKQFRRFLAVTLTLCMILSSQAISILASEILQENSGGTEMGISQDKSTDTGALLGSEQILGGEYVAEVPVEASSVPIETVSEEVENQVEETGADEGAPAVTDAEIGQNEAAELTPWELPDVEETTFAEAPSETEAAEPVTVAEEPAAAAVLPEGEAVEPAPVAEETAAVLPEGESVEPTPVTEIDVNEVLQEEAVAEVAIGADGEPIDQNTTVDVTIRDGDGQRVKEAHTDSGKTLTASVTMTHSDPLDREPAYIQIKIENDDAVSMVSSFTENGWSNIQIEDPSTGDIQIIRVYYDPTAKTLTYEVPHGATVVASLTFKTENGVTPDGSSVKLTPTIVENDFVTPSVHDNDTIGEPATGVWDAEFSWDPIDKKVSGAESNKIALNSEGAFSDTLYYTYTANSLNKDTVGDIWTDYIDVEDTLTLPEEFHFDADSLTVAVSEGAIYNSSGDKVFQIDLSGMNNIDYSVTDLSVSSDKIYFKVKINNTLKESSEIDYLSFSSWINTSIIQTAPGYAAGGVYGQDIVNHVSVTENPVVGTDVEQSEDKVKTTTEGSDGTEVDKSSSKEEKEVKAGDTIDYKITVTNTGESMVPATDTEGNPYQVVDQLPAEVYLTAAQLAELQTACGGAQYVTYDEDAGTITYTPGAIAGGSSKVISFNATVRDSAALANLQVSDKKSVTNSVSYRGKSDYVISTVRVGKVTVDKTSNHTAVKDGETVHYELTAENNTDYDAVLTESQNKITDYLPNYFILQNAFLDENKDGTPDSTTPIDFTELKYRGSTFPNVLIKSGDSYWAASVTVNWDSLVISSPVTTDGKLGAHESVVFAYDVVFDADQYNGGTDDDGNLKLSNTVTIENGERKTHESTGKEGELGIDKTIDGAKDSQGQTVQTDGVLEDGTIVDYSIKVYNDANNPYTKNIEVKDEIPGGLFPIGLKSYESGSSAGTDITDITALKSAVQDGKKITLDGVEVKVVVGGDNMITVTWTIENSADHLVGTDVNNPYVISYTTKVVTGYIQNSAAGEVTLTNKVSTKRKSDSEKIKVRNEGVEYEKYAIVDGEQKKEVSVKANQTITYRLYLINNHDREIKANHVRENLPMWNADASKGVVASGDYWGLNNGTVEIVRSDDDFVSHLANTSAGCSLYSGVLQFGDWEGVTVPANTTLVQEIKLTFPSSVTMQWTDYENKFTVNYKDPPDKVKHDPDPEEAYSLQKSVAALSRDVGSDSLSAYGTKDRFSADYTDYVFYAVTFMNTGEGTLTLKTLEDTLPEGLTYVGLAGSCSTDAIGTKKFTDSEITLSANPGAATAPEGYSWQGSTDSVPLKLKASASGSTVVIAVNDGAGAKIEEKKGICFFLLAKIDDKETVKASEKLTNTVQATTDGDAIWKPIYPELDNTPDDEEENYGESYEVGKTADGDKLAESYVSIHPVDVIVPGILKEAVAYHNNRTNKWTLLKQSEDDDPHAKSIDSQNYLKWTITLYNDGTKPITNYKIVDDLHHFEKFVSVDSFVIYDSIGNVVGDNLEEDAVFAFDEEELNTTDSTNEKQHTFVLNGDKYTIPAGGYAVMDVITTYAHGQMQGLIDNKAVFEPADEFDANSVEHGQLEKGIVDGEENYIGVSSSDYVNALGDGGTVSSKTIQEKDNPDNMGWGNRGNENKHFIYVDSSSDLVTYVNHIQNVSEDSLISLIMIDRLPEIGDVGVVNRTARDSEFSVSLAEDMGLSIEIVNMDNTISIPLVKDTDFKIEYSNLDGFSGTDFMGDDADYWTDETNGANCFRIVMDPSSVGGKIHDADGSYARGSYVLPSMWSINVTYNGKISDEATPGEFAWNSFGYHYTIEGMPGLTAEPPKVGVGIPPQPVLKKMVVDKDDVDQGEGEDTFEFMAYEITLDEDGNEVSRTPVWENAVTLKPGETCDLLPTRTVNGVPVVNGVFEDGKTYVIKETNTGDYKPTYWTVNGLKRAEGQGEVRFTYETDADIVVVCRNTPIQGNIEVSKIVQRNGSTDTTVDTTVQVGLFKLSGENYTQVGDPQTITVEDGVTTKAASFTDLDLGTYYVFELNADGSRAVGTYGQYKVTGSGAAVEITDESTKTVTITNNLEEGEITVNKTVMYNGAKDTEADGLKFTVGLFTKDGDSYKPVGTTKEISVTDGEGSVKFEHLALGTYYVFERDGDGRVESIYKEYTVTNSGTSVVLANGGDSKSVSITNAKTEKGKIVVTKEVLYNGVTDTEADDLKFTVGLFKKDGESYTPVGSTHEITVTDGVGSTTFDNLEFGTYCVFEMDGEERVEGTYKEYEVTGSGTSAEIKRSAKNGAVTITNDLEEGEITVNKTVMYNGAKDTEADDLKFKVGLFTKDGDSYTPVGTTKEISVTDGEGSVKFEHLALGTYYVFEMDGEKRVEGTYKEYAVTNSGTSVVLANGGDSKSVSITNAKTEKGKIVVTKNVFYNGAIDTDADDLKFTVGLFKKDGDSYTPVGSTHEITVTDGVGSTTFEDLDFGTYYVFEMDGEKRVEGTYKEYEVTGSGTSSEITRSAKNGAVTITNDLEEGEITVNKTVMYNGAKDTEADGLKFTVGLFTKDGDSYTPVGTAKEISVTDGEGSVKFEHLALGTYYVFEMDGEKRVEGTYKEYAVTNSGTVAAPDREERAKTVEITNSKSEKGQIVVTKNVLYNGAADTEADDLKFTVGLFKKDGDSYTPVGSTQEITVTDGAGSTTFIDLDFGTYYVFEMDGEKRVESSYNEYEVTGSGTSAEITRTAKNGAVTITNEKTEKGKIVVTKNVLYNGAVDTEADDLKFTVGLFKKDGESYTPVGSTHEITVTDGVGSTTFDDLELGTYYVFEMDGEKRVEGTYKEYVVTNSGTVAAPARGELEKTVEIINSKSEKGQIVVTKNVLYNGVIDTEADDLKFTVGLFKKDGDSYTPVGSTHEITVTDGVGSTTFKDLDFGTYYVFEMDGEKRVESSYKEYEVTGSGTSAELTRTAKNGAVTITNKKTEKGKIVVTKNVFYNGAVDTEADDLKFTVGLFKKDGDSYTPVGSTQEITVTDGVGSTTFEDLDFGTYYVFEMDGEKRVEGTYKEYEVTGSGTSAEITRSAKEGAVTITNKKTEKGKIVVTKNVLYNGAVDTEADDLKFTVGLFKKDGESYTPVGSTQEISVTDGVGSTTFEDLDFGTYYVFEMDGEERVESTYKEYEVTGSGTSAELTRTAKNGTATITNKKTEKGKIVVTKNVLYNGAVDTEADDLKFTVGLFKKDGDSYTPVGSTQEITVTDGVGSTTFEDLDFGTYYVFEMDGEKRVESTYNEYEVTGSGTSAELTRTAKNGTATITNKKTEKGKIVVTKNVLYNGAIDTDADDLIFTVGLFKKDGDSYTPVGSTHEITVTDGVGSTTFEDLDFGTYYVFEMDGEERVESTYKEYEVTGSGTSAEITRSAKEGAVTITNKKTEKGKIVVTKNVLYNGAVDTEADDLKFTVGLFKKDGEGYTPVGSTHEITVTDGVGSTTFDNLELGTYYVFEMDGEKRVEGTYKEYAVTNSGTVVAPARGELEKTVEITNSKSEKGQIVVTKNVLYNGAIDTEADDLKFTVGLFKKDGDSYTPVGSTQEITVTDGAGSTTFVNLDFGTYYVFEMDGEERVESTYKEYEVTGSGTTVEITRSAKNGTATITNKKAEKGKIVVTKSVLYNGAVDTEADDLKFTVGLFKKDGESYTPVGSTQEITVTDGVGSTTFEDLELGTYYVFEMDGEKRVEGTYKEYTVTNSGTVAAPARGELEKTVEIINSKSEKGQIKVNKTVKYAGEVNTESSESFNVGLFKKNGELMEQVGTMKTIAVTAGVGSATFGDLDFGTYYVYELDANGDLISDALGKYEVTGSGTEAVLSRAAKTATVDIVNSEKAPAVVKFSGTKKLTGKELEDGKFTFELREGTDAGADPIQTVANEGGGFSFAELTFDTVGEYQYMITEHIPAAGDADYINGVTYDSTVYIVTVKVAAGENAYTATISGLNEDGSGADFEFENEYVPKSTFAVFEGTKAFENYPDGKTPPTFEFTLSENGEVIDTVSTVGAGSFKFKTITYNKTGSHTYTVAEKKITAGGVTCDTTEYTVKVAVTDVDGELKATVSDNATKLSFKNTYEAKPVTMDFDAHKTLNGQTETKTLKAGDFTFALKDADGVILQSKPNDGEGRVTFASISYTKAGTYIYTITENVPDKKAGGITYSEEVYTVTVEVTDDGTGQLAAVKTVTNSAGSVVDAAEFTNVYDASGSVTLKGEKTLTGREFKAGDKFTFTVTADEGAPLPDPAAVTIEPTSGYTAEFEFAAIGYGLADVGKTYKYTVTESGSGPGITNDTGEHTVEVKITDNDDGTLAAVPTYSDGEKLAYTNTYDAKGSVVLKGAKTLTGREFKAGDKFTFAVTADEGAPLPDPAAVTIEPTGGKAAEYEFAAIEYGLADVDKTYVYTVTESGSGEGITNDTGTHTVTVKVTDNYDGTLKVEETYSDGTSLAIVNTYKAVGQAEILAKKNFTGRAWKDGDAFTFRLEAVTEGAPLPETTEITVTDDVAKGFGNMKFEAAGEYEYKVTEVIPEEAKRIPGVTYATEPQTVKVTATDPNHDGKLNLEVEYADAGKKYAEFTNTYKPGPTEQVIRAKKRLEGGTLKADEFSFVLMDADGKEMQLKKNDAEGNVVFDPIRYTAEDMAGATEKSFTYTITEVNSNEAGIIYDLTVHKAVVTVKDDPVTGVLVASVRYDGATEADAEVEDASEDVNEDEQVEDASEDVNEADNAEDAEGSVEEEADNVENVIMADGTSDDAAGGAAADATNGSAADASNGSAEDASSGSATDAAGGSAADTASGSATDAAGGSAADAGEAVPEFVNKVIEFHFNKVDADNANEVAGAVLVLYEVDEEGRETEVDRWTSVAGANHDFGPVLKCDATYILRETLAPRGYGRVTKDISIGIAEDGTVDTTLVKSTDKNGDTVYLLKDDAIQFQITKVVLGTVRGLSGATIALAEVDANGNLVKSASGAISILHRWVSVAGRAHDFGPYMESGKKYMLIEAMTPSGYTPIAGIAVTVEDDGTVKVNLRSLKDKNGDPVYLVENAVKPTPTPTPKGTITPTPTPKRTITPTPTPRTRITATPTPVRSKTTGARTGDDSPIEGYFLLLVAAIAVVAMTKKRSKV